MKTRQFVVILGIAAALGTTAFAQTEEAPAPPPAAANAAPDDPVVVSVYGREFKRSEVERLRRYLPAEFRGRTQGMTNKAFLESFGFLQAMSTLAKDDGFLEREPYKTQAQLNEVTFLAQSYLQMMGASIKVTPADKQAYYEANLGQFQEIRVSAIYINFTPVPEIAVKQGRPVTLESDALAKAEQLHAQLLAGADFAQLAKENSSDENSAAKGGDLGYFRSEDPLSEIIKATVFKMEPGDISAPVKDAGRFYIFQVTEKRPRPLADVDKTVDNLVTSAKLNKRLEEIRGEIKIASTDAEWLETMPAQSAQPDSR